LSRFCAKKFFDIPALREYQGHQVSRRKLVGGEKAVCVFSGTVAWIAVTADEPIPKP
jgi:hypothetical protein